MIPILMYVKLDETLNTFLSQRNDGLCPGRIRLPLALKRSRIKNHSDLLCTIAISSTDQATL